MRFAPLIWLSTLMLAACFFIDNASTEIYTPALRPQAVGSRDEMLARGKRWVDLAIPYDQGRYFEGYRQDCSGFVSMAWGLPSSEVTGTLHKHAVSVNVNDLQPGDAVNNQGIGNAGHVVMFVRWVSSSDATATTNKRFVAYEENGGWGKAVQTTLTLTRRADGSYTIAEYNASAPGPYVFQRSKYLVGSLPTVGHNGDSLLTAGEGLMATDQQIYSPSRNYVLTLQRDGNLVLYRVGGGAVWATYTQGSHRLVMQNDGNLVIYNTQNQPTWFTGTHGHFGATLAVQDDGNLVIYYNGRAIWWR